MFLIKSVSPKEKKIKLYWKLKFRSILSRLSDFTLGIPIDIYFPLKASKEKGYITENSIWSFVESGFSQWCEEVWGKRLNFPTVFLPLIKSLALLLVWGFGFFFFFLFLFCLSKCILRNSSWATLIWPFFSISTASFPSVHKHKSIFKKALEKKRDF